MTLQDWGALGELIGGVAIIISLLYVGVQLKQSTKAARAATNQAFSAQYSEIMLRITSEDVSTVFWKGLPGIGNLEGREVAAFMAVMASIVRTYETFYFEQIEGRFESPMYTAWMTQLMDLFGHEGMRDYWRLRRHNFSPEFVEYLEKKIENDPSTAMYPLGTAANPD